MNVADAYVVMPWFGSFAGGAAVALTGIARGLEACGHRVCVLTTCSRSPYRDWQRDVHPPGPAREQGLDVIRFPVDEGEPRGYHAAVRARLEGGEVSGEHQEAFFREGLNSAALAAFVAALPEGVPVLAGPYHQALVPSTVNANPGRVTVMPAFHDEPEMAWAPVRRMVLNARRMVFLTEQEKELAIRHHGVAAGRRLVESPVVGLGVELPAEVREPDALERALQRARIEHGLPERYFVYCGRLEAAKGLDHLLPWFESWWNQRLARGLEPLPMVLVGAGDTSLVGGNMALRPLGYLEEAQKAAVMRGAAALINPSANESFSYVLMESWLARRPVIVNGRCAVTTAHVNTSGGGLVYQDARSLADALDLVTDEEGLATRMGADGAAFVAARYAPAEALDRMLRALGVAA